MTFRDLFKKQKFGPLSASPIGLTVFCLLVATFFAYSYKGARNRAIADECSELIHFAEPLAIQAHWLYEQTGKWPGSLDDLRLGQDIGSSRMHAEFLQGQGIRTSFNGAKPGAGISVTLRVSVRGNEHYLACRSAELPLELVPRFCREMENTRLLEWPPRTATKPSPL